MKKVIVLLLCCISLGSKQIVKCQSILNDYKKFDIRNSSCEIIHAINIDLEKKPLSNNFLALKTDERTKYPLNNRNDVDEYINSFNKSLQKTKRSYEMQESIWAAENELRKYGVNVLSNYAQLLPSKHLTNFLMPAIQQGHELYVDLEFQEKIEQNSTKVDQMVIDLTNILYTKGIDLTTANDEVAFNNLFALAHKKIPSLGKKEYAVFNKELTKRAYDFIKKNRDDIETLGVKVDDYRKKVKQLDKQLEEFQKEVTNDVTNHLKEVGESIAVLTKNQNEIFGTLDDIKQRVITNNIQIANLEHEMVGMRTDIISLNNKQEEHSRLIAQNTFQIDILSGYTFQNLNTKQKIQGLNKGDFDKIFKPDEKQKLLRELDEIRTKETIISVATNIEQYSAAIYGGLVNSGAIKGKDAEKVGKFMSAVSIISGAARVYSGDPSGLTSIMSGIGGFSGKSKPSAEMQMLQKMMMVMNQRFDRIDEHLGKIESKIDSLSNTTINMYKTMSLSFQFTFDQMERIIWKTDILNQKATALLYKDYQKCKELMQSWNSKNINLISYKDYQSFFIQECQQCLKSLSDFTNNDVYFFVSSNESLKKEKQLEFEINEVYVPTKELFTTFYDKDLDKAMYSLMFPFYSTKDANKPYYYLSNLEGLKTTDKKEMLDDLLNCDMINEFSNFSLTFGNYFLIKGGNIDFKPLNLDEYLQDPNNGINIDLVEKRYLKILSLTRSAIAQQAMLSGHLLLDPIYSSLFSYSSNNNNLELIIKTLKNNKLLATNFATYLINNNLNMADTIRIKNLFETALSDDKKIDTLNSLIRIDDILFSSDKVNRKLYITIQRNNEQIKLQVADPNTLIENRMLNTEYIYSLSETRQKISSKLIDLSLPRNFDPVLQEKFKYYYTANTTNN